MLQQIHTIDKAEEFIRYTKLIDSTRQADSFLYFDIETTGLSARSSYLYLIGCMYLKDGDVRIEQFFSEGPEDEHLLLSAFFKLARHFETVIHFNGQTFDIPYLISKATAYEIEAPLAAMYSFDLYQKLRPLKDILGTSSMKQKSVERIAGINRQDRYDGGELITIYNRYLALKRLENIRSQSASSYKPRINSGLTTLTGSQTSSASGDLLQLLFLHNYEDVSNMLPITGLLSIRCVFEGSFSISAIEETDTCLRYILDTIPSVCMPDLNITRRTAADASFTLTSSDISRDRLILSVPIVDIELKLFYENYRDYWYLPAEDNAIHDSIGCFLDKSVKVKATRQSAYTRAAGRFIPLPAGITPDKVRTFRADYKSKQYYIALSDKEYIDSRIITSYLSAFI